LQRSFHTAVCVIAGVLGSISCLGCGGSPAPAPAGAPASPHGKLSELSRVEGEVVLCEHSVPEQVCTRHHPELIAQFKRAADWCGPHGVPESQCLECHPDLTFEPLPKLPPGADVVWVARAGEDVPSLEPYAASGKVTVFELYAEWCAACRKVDGHIYKRIAAGDQRLAYRKLNVREWESPLAQRYLRDVPSLPLLIVYGTDGKRFRALYGADLEALDRAIAEAIRQ
jgi:thiol-disulfide isomerase/thioredoxin